MRDDNLRKLFGVKGKTALVTGGGAGIGLAIAKCLAENGAKVAVVGRSVSDALPAGVFSPFEREISYFSCDLSEPDQRKGLVRKIVGESGSLDILVNNAGVQSRHEFLSYPEESWDRDIQLLLTAVFDLSKQAAVLMAGRGSGGRIINMGSISSFQGARNISAYVTAKHGLLGLTKSMAVELAPRRITVNCIAPGFIETKLLTSTGFDKEGVAPRIPMHEIGRPEDVAGTVLYLCSDAACYVTGATIPVDGGWLAR